MHRKKQLTLLLVVLAVVLFLVARKPASGRPEGQLWFYNEITGQLFAASDSSIPPIETTSGPGTGVRAWVFSCGDCANPDERFIGYLEKMHPNTKKIMDEEGPQSVQTVSGRVHWLPQGEEAKWPRFTSLVNTPVQGGSADALKQAMVDLSDKLRHTASIVSTVHDELIVECASDNADEVKALVETVMLDAVQTMFQGVRFEVEAGIYESWAEK